MIKFEKSVASRICETVVPLNSFPACGCDGVETRCREVEVELVAKHCEASATCLRVLLGLGLGLDTLLPHIRGLSGS